MHEFARRAAIEVGKETKQNIDNEVLRTILEPAITK